MCTWDHTAGFVFCFCFFVTGLIFFSIMSAKFIFFFFFFLKWRRDTATQPGSTQWGPELTVTLGAASFSTVLPGVSEDPDPHSGLPCFERRVRSAKCPQDWGLMEVWAPDVQRMKLPVSRTSVYPRVTSAGRQAQDWPGGVRAHGWKFEKRSHVTEVNSILKLVRSLQS